MKAQVPKTILLIDDEPSVTGALAVILREAGYAVVIADRVAQAMSILSSRSFDLVITDLRLADGSGIDLITHINGSTPERLLPAHPFR